MTCVICKNGKARLGKATVALEREDTTLVIKAVPAQVCANCETASATVRFKNMPTFHQGGTRNVSVHPSGLRSLNEDEAVAKDLAAFRLPHTDNDGDSLSWYPSYVRCLRSVPASLRVRMRDRTHARTVTAAV